MGPVLGGPSAALGGPPSQSLYEMAALTHEMDTQAVTTKVKEILLANNVGQKVRRFISSILSSTVTLQYLIAMYTRVFILDFFQKNLLNKT